MSMDSTTFPSLGLVEPQLSAVSARGYERPTPIQCRAIPPLLAGRDLLGCAQTGTGKTAAFALPIIQLLRASPRIPRPGACRALVVAPTRELAAQIDASFEAYGRGARLARACVFGGVGKAPQVRALERGADVLVATPGRLLDLHSEGRVRLDSVEIVVLDEADRMLDMGFIRDVRKIIALLPERRQTILFSATMPDDIAQLAGRILHDPIRVSVSPERPAVEMIEQSVAYVEKEDKRAFITALIRERGHSRALVFTRTKHGADRLARSLEREGVAASAIHANKSQNHRTRTLDGFRTGEISVLVATDLAARGIDVEGISHVYNYELPDVAETYVHRIGRTARAGAEGRALALCDTEERPLLRAIERLMRQPVPAAAGADIEAARLAAVRARDEDEAEPRNRVPGRRSAGAEIASSLRKRRIGSIVGVNREVDRGQFDSRRAGTARRLPHAGSVAGKRSSRPRPV
jgi:ATP-dependent RNA helicase RhlE